VKARCTPCAADNCTALCVNEFCRTHENENARGGVRPQKRKSREPEIPERPPMPWRYVRLSYRRKLEA
jgi:hypothetical protein